MSTRRKKASLDEAAVEQAPQRDSLLETVADTTRAQTAVRDDSGQTVKPVSDVFDALPPRVDAVATDTTDALFAPRWPTLRRDAARPLRARPPRVTPIATARAAAFETQWLAPLPQSNTLVTTTPHSAGKSITDAAVFAELQHVRRLFVLGLLAIVLAATVLVSVVVFDSVAVVAPVLPR
jgi:hypothetical protein